MTVAALHWTCPVCDAKVRVTAVTTTIASTPWQPVARVIVELDDTSLTDVYAHAWQHDQEP